MGIDILDILFLPPLFLIGIITSYQDFRYGEIKNKWIIFGLVLGAAIYLLITALNLAGFGDIFLSAIPVQLFESNWFNMVGYVLLNSFSSFFLAFLLWRFNLWSAGDAKLFFVFSFLLPLKYYFNDYFPIFPSLALFINVFLCAFLFLFGVSLFYLVKSLSFERIKKIFGENQFNFGGILKKAMSATVLKIFLNSLLVLIFVFAIAGIIAKEFQNYSHFNAGAFTIIVIMGLIIFSKWIMKFAARFNKIMIICLITGFVYILAFLPEHLNSALHFILKMVVMFSVFFAAFAILPQFCIRQTREMNMPFAIWLILGALITIILKGSVLTFFIKLGQ